MLKKYSSSVRIFYPKSDRKKIVEMLKNRIPALEKALPVLLVVLFGSYAQNRYTVRSDIDLLIVYKGKSENAYEKTRKAFGFQRIEPHIYSDVEFLEMQETIQKMIKDGIVIFQDANFSKQTLNSFTTSLKGFAYTPEDHSVTETLTKITREKQL